MKRCVIIVDQGMIEDVLTSSKEPMDIVIVDFDKKALDQTVLAELQKPYDLENVINLADMYHWDALHDPKNVSAVFEQAKRCEV